MSEKRAIIVHGWGASPEMHWFPWIKEKLEKKGFTVLVPQMPGGEHPECADWIATLKDVVGTPNNKTYFIGHSLGCIGICRYLESLPEKDQVGGVVFVAGFYTKLPFDELDDFTSKPLDAGKVKRHTNKFSFIASKDDSVVPLAKVLELQHLLSGKLILDNGKGHFNADEGVVELESALNALVEITK